MRIAREIDGEIVSIDSRQIYRRLDIGTAKASTAMREEIPHWCVDIVEPTERYSLGAYLKAARAAIDEIRRRGKRPVVVGGSGQHMRALLEGWQVPPVAEDSALRAELSERSGDSLYRELMESIREPRSRSGRPTRGESSVRWKCIASRGGRSLNGKRCVSR